MMHAHRTFFSSSERKVHKSFILPKQCICIHEDTFLWAIDEILALLDDGKWQGLKETAEKCSLNEFEVEMIFNFLAECDLVGLDKEGGKAKLRPRMHEFMREIQRIREQEAAKS